MRLPDLILSSSQKIFFFGKNFFLFLSFLFILGIIYYLIKSSWLKFIFLQDLMEIFTTKPYGVRKITKDWAKITERLEKFSESEAKLAIIEAEELLNDVLKRIGYKGETLGEKLDQLGTAIISNLNEVLEVHKIHNNIVHDPSYRLSLDEAKRIISIYEKAFRDLDVF